MSPKHLLAIIITVMCFIIYLPFCVAYHICQFVCNIAYDAYNVMNNIDSMFYNMKKMLNDRIYVSIK